MGRTDCVVGRTARRTRDRGRHRQRAAAARRGALRGSQWRHLVRFRRAAAGERRRLARCRCSCPPAAGRQPGAQPDRRFLPCRRAHRASWAKRATPTRESASTGRHCSPASSAASGRNSPRCCATPSHGIRFAANFMPAAGWTSERPSASPRSIGNCARAQHGRRSEDREAIVAWAEHSEARGSTIRRSANPIELLVGMTATSRMDRRSRARHRQHRQSMGLAGIHARRSPIHAARGAARRRFFARPDSGTESGSRCGPALASRAPGPTGCASTCRCACGRPSLAIT